jgi:hypothetical protein
VRRNPVGVERRHTRRVRGGRARKHQTSADSAVDLDGDVDRPLRQTHLVPARPSLVGECARALYVVPAPLPQLLGNMLSERRDTQDQRPYRLARYSPASTHSSTAHERVAVPSRVNSITVLPGHRVQPSVGRPF